MTNIDYSKRKYLKSEGVNALRICNYMEGNIIFKKGQQGENMFEVLEGSVGIYLHYKEPGETLLAVKKAGEFFGEIALIEDRPRTATAVALDDYTRLREISRNGFILYVKEKNDILEPITKAMSERFKEMRQQYIDACKTLYFYKKIVESGGVATKELTEQINKCMETAKKHLND